MEELKRLRLKRGQLKGAITRIETFLKDSAVLAAASLEILQARKEKLLTTYVEYENINLEILSLDGEDPEDVASTEDRYFECLSLLEKSIKGSQKNADTSNRVTSGGAKLPSIDIPIFDGREDLQFLPFLDLFTAVIDKNGALTDVQKLFYLRKYLAGEALSTIINLPLTNESYSEALLLLKKRFENKTRLIKSHINVLLDLPQMHKGTAAAIRLFISNVQQQLCALKNLQQPTEEWDMLLISILERKLDPYTKRAYHTDKPKTDVLPTMQQFIDFLEARAVALEDSAPQKTNQMCEVASTSRSKAINLVARSPAVQRSCLFCDQTDHPIYLCPKFKTEPVESRLQFVNEKALCKRCLNTHVNKCHYRYKCRYCKKDHNALLHEDKADEKSEDQVTLASKNKLQTNVLLPTVKVKLISNSGKEVIVKALLDSGSQASIIKKSLTRELNLVAVPHKTNIIGLGNNDNKVNESVNIKLQSCVNNVQFGVKCHVVESITTNLPQCHFDISSIEIPSDIKLADAEFNVPSEIDLLLGADIYFKALLDGHIKVSGGLVLQNTIFGYIVGGAIGSSLMCNAIHVGTNIVTNFITERETSNSSLDSIMEQFWLSEKVPEERPRQSNSEFEKAEECFKNSVQLIDNRFYVDMPLKAPLEEIRIGDSFSVALQRFLSLENKFKSNSLYFEQYKKFIDEYLQLGHAKIVDICKYDINSDPVYFLAHHAVFNEASKTTKVRVVFNGSMKSRSKVSLNDVMLNGPTVQNELFNILTLFRTYRYTLMCDAEKMFRQIYINEHHRGLQNILWRDDPKKPISCLQLQTVTYGLRASTYLSTRCVLELALLYKEQYPLAAQAIMKNTYVDDVICGSDSKKELVELKNQLTELFKLGSMKLHKWCSNSMELLDDMPENQRYFEQIDLNKDNVIKTLGLKYNVVSDTLTFACPSSEEQNINTKRKVLSFIGKMFDPLGVIGPIIVNAKLFMQQLWDLKVDWDSVLPASHLEKWLAFLQDLKAMGTISIPRLLLECGGVKSVELVGYCDASFKALGCCLYLRSIHLNGNVESNLICSKSRVAPLELQSSKSHVESVENFCSAHSIKFKFIPSYSPEFGGLWEAGVISLKYHFKRVVGNLCLTFEELYTVVTQIEAILNSRPLLPMSSDVSDYKYLTPGHFLIGDAMTSYPELDLTEVNVKSLQA